MLTERIQQSYTSTKYYQFATILEHVIDCFHTIVSDETNPYHPPLAWLTRKQPKPPEDELFLDLMDECSRIDKCGTISNRQTSTLNSSSIQLSSSIRTRLERCPRDTRREIVSRVKDGCAPLFMACRNGLTSVARYLIEVCGANIEQGGHYEALEDHHVHSVSPIWVGSVSGHLDIVKLLIERGANVNSLSDTGSTPLRSVCFLCKDDEYNNCVRDNASDHEDDYLANDMLPSFSQQDGESIEDVYMLIVRALVENGANVHQANYSGGTCLINSIHNQKLVEYILDQGADVNVTDNHSKTALHYAIQQGRLETVRLLISRGADPFWCAAYNDDALQLSCTKGHEEIFEYLIGQFSYSAERLADAYKLIGSSILEIHYDLAKVRRYWTKALQVRQQQQDPLKSVYSSQRQSHRSGRQSLTAYASNTRTDNSQPNNDWVDLEVECDIRRKIAFGDIEEFQTEAELQALTVEDFRIQSLIISERIFGVNHRETIQRLLYRGNFYINSLRPNRCIELWIYALKLRLGQDSIFHFESIFAAQAIAKLFLDLFCQQQQHQVKFRDVYDVLVLLVDRLEESKRHLDWRPRSCLHEDIFDLLLEIIVNLLLALKCIAAGPQETENANLLIDKLIKLNPTSSKGSSLLHICVSPSMFEGDVYRCFAIPTTPAVGRERRQGQTRGQGGNVNAGLPNSEHQNRTRDQLDIVDNGGFGNNSLRASTSNVDFHRQVDNGNRNLAQPGPQSNNYETIDRQHQLARTSTQRAETLSTTSGRKSPLVNLIETLLERGLDVDQADASGFSALQALCLSASIRAADKKEMIGLLIGRSAHVDRKTLTPEQGSLIRQALREAGINGLDYTTLACLAAREVAKLGARLDSDDEKFLVKSLRDSIAIH